MTASSMIMFIESMVSFLFVHNALFQTGNHQQQNGSITIEQLSKRHEKPLVGCVRVGNGRQTYHFGGVLVWPSVRSLSLHARVILEN